MPIRNAKTDPTGLEYSDPVLEVKKNRIRDTAADLRYAFFSPSALFYEKTCLQKKITRVTRKRKFGSFL